MQPTLKWSFLVKVRRNAATTCSSGLSSSCARRKNTRQASVSGPERLHVVPLYSPPCLAPPRPGDTRRHRGGTAEGRRREKTRSLFQSSSETRRTLRMLSSGRSSRISSMVLSFLLSFSLLVSISTPAGASVRGEGGGCGARGVGFFVRYFPVTIAIQGKPESLGLGITATITLSDGRREAKFVLEDDIELYALS